MPEIPVLVLDGETGFAPMVVRSLGAARRWDIHLIAKSTDPKHRPSIAWSRHVKSVHLLPNNLDEEAMIAAIADIVRKTESQAILPFIEATSLFCIRHREALTKIARLAPLASAESFSTAIDKGLLGLFMARHALPHPRSLLPDDPQLASLAYPLLVKPRRDSGGRGIVKVTSPEALRRELSRPDRTNVCVQEYIDSDDLDCSILARDGEIIAWTTQRGLRRSQPYASFSEIQMEAHPAALEAVSQLMRALNWSGIANVDLLVDKRTGQTFILEVNGRYWASLWASTLANVNFPDLVCRVTLGEALPDTRLRPGRFMGFSLLLRDLVSLRLSFRNAPWTSVPAVLSDPLPAVLALWRRLIGATP